MITRLRSSMASVGIAPMRMKAVNSVSTSFTPSSEPAVEASSQRIPSAQASGAKMMPRIRSTETGAPDTSPNAPRMALTIATRATNTIRVAATLSTIERPSEVPLIRASTELS